MAYLLIIIGIVLIGCYFLLQNNESPEKPPPVPTKYIYTAGGVGSLMLAVYLLYTVFFNFDTTIRLFSAVLCLGAIYGTVKFFQAMSTADEVEAKNMEFRAKAMANNLMHQISQIGVENAQKNAAAEEELKRKKRETEIAQLKTEKREVELRDNLVDYAEDKGLDVDSLIGVNHYHQSKMVDLKYKKIEKDIELESEAKQIHLQMDAADRVEHYKIVDDLEAKLEELLIKRREVELHENDEVLRQQKVARLNKRIAKLEEDIDGRQDRLLSSSDWKDPKRLT